MILEPKKGKLATASTFSPSVCDELMRLHAKILAYFNVEFQASFFILFFFMLFKRLFSYSLLSSIRVVLSAYMRWFICLLEILIPACDSFTLAFQWGTLHISYIRREKIYSLLYSFLSFEPVSCSMSGSVAFWPTYRLLRGQVSWSGIPISLRNFQFVVIPKVKGFSIVNKAEISVFFWNSPAFSMNQEMLAIWSLVPLSLPLTQLGHLKVLSSCNADSSLNDFAHNLASIMKWEQLYSNLNILWHCLFGGLECNLNFSSPVDTAEFSNLLTYWVEYFNSIIL